MPKTDQADTVTSKPDSEDIKLFSCSTQLSMNFFLLVNVKMPTIVGILTFNNCWHFNIYERENSILGLSEPKNAEFLDILYL